MQLRTGCFPVGRSGVAVQLRLSQHATPLTPLRGLQRKGQIIVAVYAVRIDIDCCRGVDAALARQLVQVRTSLPMQTRQQGDAACFFGPVAMQGAIQRQCSGLWMPVHLPLGLAQCGFCGGGLYAGTVVA